MGLSAPMRLTVYCCWSYDHDTRRREGQRKGVSLAGSHARRDGWMQLTAFGARDRGFFEVILRSAPRRQLKRSTLGRAIKAVLHCIVFCPISTTTLSII
jgi:hypothetical protein